MNIDKIEYRAAKQTVKVCKTKSSTKTTKVCVFVRKDRVWITATEAGLVNDSIASEGLKNTKLVEVYTAAGLDVPETIKIAAAKEAAEQEVKAFDKKQKREAEYRQGYDAYMSEKKDRAEIAANRRWGRLEAEFKGE